MTEKKDLMEIGETEDLQKGQIIQTPISSEMKKAYLDYAMSVIVSRALPEVRDGLKPVQRRIVYAAHQMGLTHEARYTKSAKWVGEVIGKYHPHGDSSIYDALVRMAQDFSLRYPLVDGQGNFGDIDGNVAAAYRYTEARLAKISEYLLKDIDKNTVEFIDNYSAEIQEPTVLPSILPNLLMNGSIGIAVGMATNIPPHNLTELIDTAFQIIEKSKVNVISTETQKIRAYDLIETEAEVKKWEIDNPLEVEEIAQTLKGPDFPTGCTIYDHSEILRYYATGRGRIIQRATSKIVEEKGGKFSIVITEIPYMLTISSLVEKIALLVTNKKIKEIADIRDESAKGKIRIVVELKRDSRPQKVLNNLYKYTPLQTAFNANMLALIDGEPQTIGVKEYFHQYFLHRRDVITNRTIFLLIKAREREHILEGLKKALDAIDEVIDTIRKSKDQEEAKNNLMKRFDLTAIQAQAILDMQLKKLAALEREKIENELAEIQKNIKKYLGILANPQTMIDVIKQELTEVKEKFGDERKTKVIKGKIGEFEEEDLIASETTLISLTESGYIKRMSPDTYKTQSRGGKGVMGMKTKDEDEVSMLRLADTHDRLLVFTNEGKVYEKRVWDIPEASRTSKGTAIVNLLDMSTSEKPEEVITVSQSQEKDDKEYFIFVATKKGNVKKTSLKEFENIRRTGIIAMGLKDNDKLVRAKLTEGNSQVILITSQGKSIRFDESDVRPMGRSASGVRGIKLKGDDQVVSMEIFPEIMKDEKIFTISENGHGKMTAVKDFTLQNRGGSGIIIAKVTPKTGPITVAKVINDKSNDVLITSNSGQVIRIPIKSVPTLNRNTQGVILMRLNSGDKVSTATVFEEETENAEKSS